MRIAIVADVHANAEALGAVLRHAEAGGALDGVWCLGDIVGYGPEPDAVIASLRARPLTAVAGNHDLAAAALMDVDAFNPAAAGAAIWTRGHTGRDELAFLAALPLTHSAGDFALAHGSLRDPAWEYLLTPEQADAQFAHQPGAWSLVGHTHLPAWWEERPGQAPAGHGARDGEALRLERGARRILNPGSVGQPRDGDPRAAYILLDDAAGTATWHRVAYDIAATQAKMRAAGLHAWLIARLAEGR